jgi:uncharacterized membrane protein YbhN (UPF0104 family)
MRSVRALTHRRRGPLRAAAAVLVAVVLLLLVLHAVPPGELWETLSSVQPGLVGLAALAAFAFICARAWRYALLLRVDRPGDPRTILAVTLASWGFNLLLPGPGGDAAFVVLARRRLNTPPVVGVGAAVLSRLLDVSSLLLIALVTAPLAGVALHRFALIAGLGLAVLIAVGLTALFWSWSRQAIVRWLERLPLPPSIHNPLHYAIEELGSGSRPRLLVLATVAARVATGLQYLALFAAIGQPISLVGVWFALSIRTLLLAVPLQGIGGLGTTQLWWTAGLTLLGWPAEDALAASLAVHLVDLFVSLPQAAIGWALLGFSAPEPAAREQVAAAARAVSGRD